MRFLTRLAILSLATLGALRARPAAADATPVFVERGTISGDDGATRLGGEVTVLAPVLTWATLSGTPLRLAVYASLGAGQARLAGATAAVDIETRQVYLTSGLPLLDL